MNRNKYCIANWKMSQHIENVDCFINKLNKYNKKINSKIIICPSNVHLERVDRLNSNNNFSLGAQNCHDKDNGAYTGENSVSMIKEFNCEYVILGHSENRASGENNQIIKEKISIALKNNFTIIFCIGENKQQKREKKTINVLKSQISKVIKNKYNLKKIIIAYEPIWSIGSGKLPSSSELEKNIVILKKFIKQKFRLNYNTKLIYGGSVDKKSISDFKSIKELDGFLIGGASKSSNNFIDIIKNFYK